MKLGHFISLLFFTASFLVLVRRLFVRGHLSMRYALGWVLIGVLFLFFPLLLIIGDATSARVDIRPSIIYLGLPILVLLMICVQLTISISGLTKRIQDLAESVAIMDHELDAAGTTSHLGEEDQK